MNELTQRRLWAAASLAGAVMLLVAVIGSSFWINRIDFPAGTIDLKVGLTSVTGCAHDPNGVWRCESVDWETIGAPPGSGLWVWSGRLLFGIAIAAAVCFALVAVIAAVPLDVNMPVSPARVGLAFAIAGLALVGLYYISRPDWVDMLLEKGRGWWFVMGGLVFGGAGTIGELRARD
jgi:hypothetical protein